METITPSEKQLHLQKINTQKRTAAVAQAQADISAIKNVGDVWEKYTRNPGSLASDERELLEKNIATLRITDDEVQKFAALEGQYNTMPKAPVLDFNQFLRNLMVSDLTMDDVEKWILQIKKEITLSEDDLMQCIAIVSGGIQCTEDTRGYDKLLKILKKDLANKLRNTYRENPSVLLNVDRDFLAENIKLLEIKFTDIQTFIALKSEYDRNKIYRYPDLHYFKVRI